MGFQNPNKQAKLGEGRHLDKRLVIGKSPISIWPEATDDMDLSRYFNMAAKKPLESGLLIYI